MSNFQTARQLLLQERARALPEDQREQYRQTLHGLRQTVWTKCDGRPPRSLLEDVEDQLLTSHELGRPISLDAADFNARRHEAIVTERADQLRAEKEARAQVSQLAADGADTGPTWQPIDLTSHLDGTHTPPTPELMARTDGEHLLYPSLVHSVHGESESGKSMIMHTVTADELKAGNNVLLLDYESDATTVVDRLLKMGVPAEALAKHLHYLNPGTDPTTGPPEENDAWTRLLDNTYRLAIIDGVTEAFAVSGVSSIDNDEVTAWGRAVPKRIASKTGAAVVVIDHVTKSSEGRGRFAIGAQSKMNYLTGAAYTLEVIDPIGVGMSGRLSLRIGKDRPGQVRPISYRWRKSDRTQEAAVITIDSTDPDRINYSLDAPPQSIDHGEFLADRYDELQRNITDWIKDCAKPQSLNQVKKGVPGRGEDVGAALEALVRDGVVTRAPGPRNSILHSLTTGSGPAPIERGAGPSPGNQSEPVGTGGNRDLEQSSIQRTAS